MTDRIVHLHVGRSVHPIYAEQLHALPEGFRYRYVHPGLGDATTPTKRIVEQRDTLREARTRAKELAARTLARAGYVRLSTPRIGDDVDLIHSAQFMLRNPPKPYVVDFEQVGVFSLYQQLALTRPWARERLRRAILDDRCKHLLPWSDAARDGLLQRRRRQRRAQGHDAAARRSAPRSPRPKTRGDGPLRVLFVGTAFYEKGGVEAIRAATRARERPARRHQLRPRRLRRAGGRDRPRARPPRPGRAPVRPVPRAAVPEPHGHVRLGRDRGDGPRPAGDRARPPRAQRADRRRLRPAASRPRTCSTATTGSRTTRSRCRCRRTSSRRCAIRARRTWTGSRRRSRGSRTTTRSTSGSPPARSPASPDSMEHRRAELARIYGDAIS